MSHSSIDLSPPVYRGSLDPLDKDAFHKSISVLAARVSAPDTYTAVHSPALKQYDYFIKSPVSALTFCKKFPCRHS